MRPPWHTSAWGGLIARLGEGLADPAAIAVLQGRLARHGAEISGQLPELLLRAPDPQAAVRDWLADKDLSHWIPQAEGGTARQGWQFETATWNRARGAEVVEGWEIGRAHLDGGLDALAAEGMPQALMAESLEAALVATGLSLGLALLRRRREWSAADPAERGQLLLEALAATGLGALSGAALSLVLSVALALVPGGQVLLVGLSVMALSRSLPGPGDDPFQIVQRKRSDQQQEAFTSAAAPEIPPEGDEHISKAG